MDKKNSIYTYKLSKPFEFEGKKYEVLNLDFERLTGRDMINIEIEIVGRNEVVISPELSRIYQCHIASKAANVSVDVLEALPFVEFNRITNIARNFLLASSI